MSSPIISPPHFFHSHLSIHISASHYFFPATKPLPSSHSHTHHLLQLLSTSGAGRQETNLHNRSRASYLVLPPLSVCLLHSLSFSTTLHLSPPLSILSCHSPSFLANVQYICLHHSPFFYITFYVKFLHHDSKSYIFLVQVLQSLEARTG